MLAYLAASGCPALLLVASNLVSPVWALPALAWMIVFIPLGDRFLGGLSLIPEREGGALGRMLPAGIILAHFLLSVLAVGSIADAAAGGWATALFLSHGLFFGQVSIPAAHELIHRSSRWERRLGAAVFTSLLFGHHAIAHPAVHHVWVATPLDPNTPRKGESFWLFFPRAWLGSFRAGLAVAMRRAQRKGKAPLGIANPYWAYLGGAAAALGLAMWFSGWGGVLIWILLSLHAQGQLLLSDYVQHYGLQRKHLLSGRYEPVAAAHSWDAPPPFSRLMMLNAPSHADHHLHPSRHFHALVEPQESGAPLLPFSLPVAGVIALFPRLWRKRIDPLVPIGGGDFGAV